MKINAIILTCLLFCSCKSRKSTQITFTSPFPFLSEINSSNNYSNFNNLLRIGRYSEFQKLYEESYSNSLKKRDSVFSRLPLGNYEFKSGIESIIAEAKKHKVVFLNENHHSPYSRIFTMQLLTELNKIEFNTIGMEFHVDSFYFENHYPKNYSSYQGEPQFGNFLRKCNELGVSIFNYEGSFNDMINYQSLNKGLQLEERREHIAANNILNFIQKNPNQKLLIYCGHQHSFESTPSFINTKTLANLFKEKSEIDPLTIDQSYYGPLYFARDKTTLPVQNKASVMQNSNGYLGSLDNEPIVDMMIFTDFKDNNKSRPLWLFDKEYRPRKIKIPAEFRDEEEIIVFAYSQNESYSDAVPRDAYQPNTKKKYVVLSLPAGDYNIIFHSKNLNYLQKISY